MTALRRQKTRTCIACGAKGDKYALMRIVRSPQGEVAFDASGKAAGRGAYVCSRECFEAAVKSGKFDRALRCRVAQEHMQRVADELSAASELLEIR